MEQEKKGLLKSLISKTTSVAKKVPGVLKRVSDKVGDVMAAPGLALSDKIVKTIEKRNNVGQGMQKPMGRIGEPLKDSIPFPKTPKSLPLNSPSAVPKWKSNNPAYNKAEKNNTLGRGFGEPAGAAPLLKKLVKKASK